MLKRYLLFAGPTYYPAGGWQDFAGSYDTLDEAKDAAVNRRITDWWHVIDAHTGEEVWAN